MNEYDEVSHLLAKAIRTADAQGDKEEIKFLRSLWDNESWASIMRKLDTEGSAWVVWWEDGVSKFNSYLDK